MKRDELRAIERVLRGREVRGADYLFCSERGARLTRNGFWRVVSEAGKRARLPMNVIHAPAEARDGLLPREQGLRSQVDSGVPCAQVRAEYRRYAALNARRFEGLW